MEPIQIRSSPLQTGIENNSDPWSAAHGSNSYNYILIQNHCGSVTIKSMGVYFSVMGVYFVFLLILELSTSKMNVSPDDSKALRHQNYQKSRNSRGEKKKNVLEVFSVSEILEIATDFVTDP